MTVTTKAFFLKIPWPFRKQAINYALSVKCQDFLGMIVVWFLSLPFLQFVFSCFDVQPAYNKDIAFFKRKEILTVDEKLTVYNIKYKIVNRQNESATHLTKGLSLFKDFGDLLEEASNSNTDCSQLDHLKVTVEKKSQELIKRMGVKFCRVNSRHQYFLCQLVINCYCSVGKFLLIYCLHQTLPFQIIFLEICQKQLVFSLLRISFRIEL